MTRQVCARRYTPAWDARMGLHRLVKCGALAVVTVAGVPVCRAHISVVVMDLIEGGAVRVEDAR